MGEEISLVVASPFPSLWPWAGVLKGFVSGTHPWTEPLGQWQSLLAHLWATWNQRLLPAGGCPTSAQQPKRPAGNLAGMGGPPDAVSWLGGTSRPWGSVLTREVRRHMQAAGCVGPLKTWVSARGVLGPPLLSWFHL